MSLTGNEMELLDAIGEAARVAGLDGTDNAGLRAVWFTAELGVPLGEASPSSYEASMRDVRRLAQACGCWISRSDDGVAEGVSLARWRQTVPMLLPVVIAWPKRDSWGVPTGPGEAGPMHLVRAQARGQSLCGAGLMTAESQNTVRWLPVPNEDLHGAWCVACLQGMSDAA